MPKKKSANTSKTATKKKNYYKKKDSWKKSKGKIHIKKERRN